MSSLSYFQGVHLMDLINRTLPTELILVGFTDDPKINSGLFVLFLAIYLITIVGNAFMICLIIISPHLHAPMYFFLCNLAFIDFFYSTNTVPRMLVDLLSTRRIITLLGCGTQLYVGLLLGNTESALLVVMAYDRYNAICKPLYYPVLMRWSICYGLITFMWIYSFVITVVPGLLQPMRICYSVINHFTCEVLAIIKLSCDNTEKNELVIFSLSFCSLLLPFSCILVSYVCIISSIGKIHSVGKSKAFSTCTSHVTVVCLFYGTAMIMYFGPSSHYSSNQGKYVSIFYGVIIPMLNPLIYSLKNQEVKKVLQLRSSGCRTIHD